MHCGTITCKSTISAIKIDLKEYAKRMNNKIDKRIDSGDTENKWWLPEGRWVGR